MNSVLLDRMIAKVNADGACWEWNGARREDRYGIAWDGHRQVRAHRLMYELLVGPIPQGLVIDHLCRVHHCVNPDHMEPVPHRVNSERGYPPNMRWHRASTCSRGHDLTQAGSTYTERRGDRNRIRCLRCRHIRRGVE